MEGSQFTFHLDQLAKAGYVLKVEGKYALTESGKELANRMDLGDTSIEQQAKVSVLMTCQRENNGETEYLLYTRLKSPFYSYQGFPTGKVKIGESILEAAKRELQEETGLVGEPELFSIRHYRVYNNEKKLLEDKIFFVCRFINPWGELVENQEGTYKWVKQQDIWDYLKKPIQEVKDILQIFDQKELSFSESEYSTEDF